MFADSFLKLRKTMTANNVFVSVAQRKFSIGRKRKKPKKMWEGLQRE